jgi:hypothetical protein
LAWLPSPASLLRLLHIARIARRLFLPDGIFQMTSGSRPRLGPWTGRRNPAY